MRYLSVLIRAGFALAMLIIANAALAQERVALVIGNSTYLDVAPLKNPVNDAADIGAALTRIGFDVTVETDLDARSMNRVLANFARIARNSDQAILYFAGHGVEIENTNYLIPVDANINDKFDVSFQSIELDKLLQTVEGAKSLKLVMLDACRDNPFPFMLAGSTRSLTRGLARIEPPGGVLVSYAARGGTVAYDGDGRNSPYASAILENIETPGLEIGKLFRQIRDSVYRSTAGLQEPFTYGSLPAQDIFLAGAAARNIYDDFAMAQSLGSVVAWDSFLSTHSDSVGNAGLIDAARRLRDLAAGTITTAPAPAPVEIIEPTDPKEAELALDMDRDARRQFQTALGDLGFSSGTPDGVFGRKTRSAITQFQRRYGLEETGFVSAKLMADMERITATSPPNLNGLWELTVLRLSTNQADAGGHGFRGRQDIIAVMQIRISGRVVEMVRFSDATVSPNKRPPALRATISESGLLSLSFVVNYEHFKDRARRVLIAFDLPKRLPMDHVAESPTSALGGQYRVLGSFRRLSASEDSYTWDPNR